MKDAHTQTDRETYGVDWNCMIETTEKKELLYDVESMQTHIHSDTHAGQN